HPWVFNTAATTPHDVETDGELFFPSVENAAIKRELIAIGETGLDYFYEHSNRKCQLNFLEKYLDLSLRTKLPIIFHCRDAFDDLFSKCDEMYRNQKALLHCFTGTIAEAKGVIDRNWFLSISGIATFKKSQELRDVIKYTPIESLLIETDSPYLAPQSHRGKMNEPSFILETIRLVSEVKKLDYEETISTIASNTESFFSFSKVS
ncbi:MAG: TatD family deoxyribonuclease, partial [Chlamydiae bacterium]|nr:TatD family deoxyribonuclease [Chlamydiota bacterium]